MTEFGPFVPFGQRVTHADAFVFFPDNPRKAAVMNIAVLNGSPKGLTSVTMQYVLFLQKKLPQHTFVILNVCQDIKKLEGDHEALREVMRSIAAADCLLWAFPLYYML